MFSFHSRFLFLIAIGIRSACGGVSRNRELRRISRRQPGWSPSKIHLAEETFHHLGSPYVGGFPHISLFHLLIQFSKFELGFSSLSFSQFRYQHSPPFYIGWTLWNHQGTERRDIIVIYHEQCRSFRVCRPFISEQYLFVTRCIGGTRFIWSNPLL